MDELLEQERIARLSGKIKKLEEIQHTIISKCESTEEIISTLRLLINKRKQEPECIKKLIGTIFNEHKDIPFLKDLLSRVIEGRIFLEDERVDIAEYIKNQLGNNIEESYEIIKNIPVETFTTISDKKRNQMLFEQFRIALLLNKLDYAGLTSRKVRKNYLSNDEKIVFLNYSILLKIALNRFLEASELYLELYKVDESRKYIAIGSLYCLMSSCLVEDQNIIEKKNNLLKTFYEFKNNDEILRVYLKKFCSDLIIDFKTSEDIIKCVSKYSNGVNRDLLNASIMEHNLFVVSKFFSKIKIEQMAELIKVNEDDLIGFISEMVNEKFCNIKINQQQRLIHFGDKHWNSNVGNVLDKIVLVGHLIHKQSLSKN